MVLDFVDEDLDGTAQADELSRRYLWGQAVDQLFAQEDVDDLLSADAEDVKWALTDNLGSVRDLVTYDDALGVTAIAAHITYDTFGNITSGDDAATRYLYTAQECDAATGEWYYDQRWYSSYTATFLSSDPIEDDYNNSYRYVSNSPTNATDPTGLEERERGPVFDTVYWMLAWDTFKTSKPVNGPPTGVIDPPRSPRGAPSRVSASPPSGPGGGLGWAKNGRPSELMPGTSGGQNAQRMMTRVPTPAEAKEAGDEIRRFINTIDVYGAGHFDIQPNQQTWEDSAELMSNGANAMLIGALVEGAVSGVGLRRRLHQRSPRCAAFDAPIARTAPDAHRRPRRGEQLLLANHHRHHVPRLRHLQLRRGDRNGGAAVYVVAKYGNHSKCE